jgi:hypothetical protein
MDTGELIAHALLFLSAWIVLSFPVAVFIGRAIAFGTRDLPAPQDAALATLARPALGPSADRTAA